MHSSVLLISAALAAAPAALSAPLRRRQPTSSPAVSRRALGRRGLYAPAKAKAEGRKDHEEVESNWAGAILDAQDPSGDGWRTVSGTVTVPTPRVPSGGDSGTSYSSSAWVGIDGANCQSAIWQAGFDFSISNGQVSFDPWYEWYPQDSVYWDKSTIQLSPGDTVSMSVTATSANTGTTVIKNLSNGQSVTGDASDDSNSLCFQDAELIVEDFNPPEAAFDTITFSDASAVSANGNNGDWSQASITNLELDNRTRTDTSVSGNSVSITWIDN